MTILHDTFNVAKPNWYCYLVVVTVYDYDGIV